jgi:hypothetical protein
MLLATATSAGTLAQEINVVTNQITQVNSVINNNATITGGSLQVNDPIIGQFTQTIATLTLAESQTVFNSMLTILNARLTTFQSALAAM